MKYLKEELDIKAGIKKFKNWYKFRDIHKICKEYRIENYHINDDEMVDVNDDVFLFKKGLDKIPLQFGEVSGRFWCQNNDLINLIGSPKRVGEDFICRYNNLTSLEGCPTYIGDSFFCEGNPNLWSFDHFPKYIRKHIFLRGTPIEPIFDLFGDVYREDGGKYFSTNWSLMDFFEHCDPVWPGKIIKKRRLKNFLASIGRELYTWNIQELKNKGWKIED